MTDLPLIIDDRETPKFWVNRATMVEPEILEQERASIFDKCWLYVGHESELPNEHDFRTRRVGGKPVIFVRNEENKINVLVNVCPHRGMILETRKEGNARKLRCFYHGWSFNADGDLVTLPGEESYPDGWQRSERCLPRPPHVESFRGFWFLCWDKEQPLSLKEYLAGASDYLELIADQSHSLMQVSSGTHHYCMEANWKLLVENSIDGYHALTTHNRYFQMVAASGVDLKSRMGSMTSSAGGPDRGGVDLGNGHAAVGGTDTSHGKTPGNLARAFSNDQERKEYQNYRAGLLEKHGEQWTNRILGGRNLLIYPNFIIVDGVGMGCTLRTFYPVRPDYLEITAWEINPPEAPESLLRARKSGFLTFWGPSGLATPDDVEALARCQLGFASYEVDPWNDISRGMGREFPGGADELQMRAFWRRYNEMMTGEIAQPEIKPYELFDKKVAGADS